MFFYVSDYRAVTLAMVILSQVTPASKRGSVGCFTKKIAKFEAGGGVKFEIELVSAT